MKIHRATITASEHEHRGVEVIYTDRYEADVNGKHLEALEFDEITRLIDVELDPVYNTSGSRELRYIYIGPIFKGDQHVGDATADNPMITFAVSAPQAASRFRHQLKVKHRMDTYVYNIDPNRIVQAAVESPKWTKSRLSNHFKLQYADDPCVGLTARELEAVMDPFYNNVDGLRDKIVDCLWDEIPELATADDVRIDIDPRPDTPDYQFIIDDFVVFIDIDSDGDPFVTEW